VKALTRLTVAMRPQVRSLAKASFAYASSFPVVRMRKKLRQNIRELFFAYRKVDHEHAIDSLVHKGWTHLNTMQELQSLHASNDAFFDLLSRKKQAE
jgi:hypothetical protein